MCSCASRKGSCNNYSANSALLNNPIAAGPAKTISTAGKMKKTRGNVSFTDALATHFHFTFWGAARTATWSYLVGMLRALTGGRIPRTA